MNDKVNKAYPFLDSTRKELEECIQTVIDNYAKIVARGDKEFALKQLRAQLREEIVFSRNTIWRDMVGAHSKGYTGQGSSSQPVGAGISDGKVASVVKQQLKWKSKELIGGLVGAIAFIVLTNVDTMGRKEESNCLAIIVLAAIFWALEVSFYFIVKRQYCIDSYLGGPALCHISVDTSLGHRPSCHSLSRWQRHSTFFTRCGQIHLFTNVQSDYHAFDWWFHACSSS